MRSPASVFPRRRLVASVSCTRSSLRPSEASGERIVDQILQNGPAAIRETKALALQSAWSHLDDAAFDRLVERHADRRLSAEAAEGLASFKEKRPAKW